MKIKTRFFIILILPFVLALGAGLIAFTSLRELKEALTKEQKSQEIVRSVSELNILTNDYLFRGSERSRTQWLNKYDSLTHIIKSVDFTDPERKALFDDVRRNHGEIKTLFAELTTNHENMKPGVADSGESNELKSVLIGHLLSKSQEIVSDASRLAKAKILMAEAWHQKSNLLILVSIVFMAFVMGAALFITMQTILHPLVEFQQATRTVASGNLDYRVKIRKEDEIGLLANAFNDMAGKLKKSYNDLEDDITKRKKAEEELQKSEERFELAVQGSKDGIWDWTVGKEEAYYSPRLKEMLGYHYPEFPNLFSAFESHIHPGDRAGVLQKLDLHLKTKAPYDVDFRMRTKKGDYRWFSARGQAVWNDEGAPVRMAGSLTDITERRNLEMQLFQAQKMEAIGQLAGGVAHDFNNILSAIIGYSHLIDQRLESDDPVRGDLEEISLAAERAIEVTRSLLAFSRRQLIDPKPADLCDIVRKVERLLGRLLTEDIELKTTFAGEKLVILADTTQIEQVLINLATNARDSMPGGGSLTIGLSTVEIDDLFVNVHGYGDPGRYHVITVEDTGIGMDETTRLRIFEPFFTTKEEGKGTGLGLAMVYGIVKQHDGFINVYSEPGSGTLFRIYLPALDAAAPEASPRDKLSTIAEGGTETILVAEDDAALRKLAKVVLETAGYTVIPAEDGEDAVRQFMESGDIIALVVLDLIMPKKNGKEAYYEIKKMKPDVKTLFVSGYSADIMNKKGILDEGLEYILKPISPRDLMKKVRQILDQ